MSLDKSKGEEWTYLEEFSQTFIFLQEDLGVLFGFVILSVFVEISFLQQQLSVGRLTTKRKAVQNIYQSKKRSTQFLGFVGVVFQTFQQDPARRNQLIYSKS